jgi:oxalate decarboxylase
VVPTKLLARPWARRESASTFLVTDFLAHIPKEVLAKNFGVPESAFANIPEEELYIFQSKVPGPLAADRGVGAGPPPFAFSHRLMAQEPIRTNAGSVRIVDSNNFPASKMIAAGLVEVEPGGMRELHWHPNADELQYYIEGEGRMTVYASNTNAQTFDYQGGDVGYVPKSLPHYIENTGAAKLLAGAMVGVYTIRAREGAFAGNADIRRSFCLHILGSQPLGFSI